MDKSQLKVTGIISLVICTICLFVAIERYNTNSNNVNAMNAFGQSSPFGSMMGQGKLKPATPAATKYALFFAFLSGLGGTVALMKSTSAQKK